MPDDLAPRHLQLRDLLLRRWKIAGLKIGDRIESQNEITRSCDFSLITVIKTLKDLEAEGVIERQVGRGSFLKRLPWAESYRRIGLFYNRDTIEGGIFRNDVHTRVVAAIENTIVSSGDSFILGSFTHSKMPLAIWDRLDAVVLTGITHRTNIEALESTTSVISTIDTALPSTEFDCFRLDMRPAFEKMFASFGYTPQKLLYLDSVHSSSERQERLSAFMAAADAAGTQHEIRILHVDQENATGDVEAIQASCRAFDPNFICGYMHKSWPALLREISPALVTYRFTLDPNEGGFYIDEADWVQSVVDRIYAQIDDRTLAANVFKYPARFVA